MLIVIYPNEPSQPRPKNAANHEMNSVMNSQLSALLKEQASLRTEMESLFSQRAAINLQMKEIEERLQFLDGEIDRVENAEENNQRYAPTQQAEATQHAGAIVKREPNGATQPEEFLTDPTDVYEESATANGGTNNGISNQNDVVDLSNSQDKEPGQMNPFGDLWSASDRQQFEHDNQNQNNTFKSKTSDSASNTLEKYFVRTHPPSIAAVPQHQQTNQSITPNPYKTNGTKSTDNNQQYPWTERLYHHLKRTFRLSSFRDNQLSIINGTLSSKDVFVIMRTGGGKSLTYQLPAILEMESTYKKVTVVISPLISLIRDQEEQMNEMYPGSALSFTSGMGKEEHAARWARVRDPNGGVALVFVTPEKVGKSGKFKGEMEKLWGMGRLGRFVIGEW